MVKNIVYELPNGRIIVSTPAQSWVECVTGRGLDNRYPLKPFEDWRDELAVSHGMSRATASELAAAYVTGGLAEQRAIDLAAEMLLPTGGELVGVVDSLPVVQAQDFYVENGAAVKRDVDDPARHFRDAWRWDAGSKSVVISDVAADDVLRVNARVIRDKLLQETDKDEFRLAGQALVDLRAYRKSLRDLGEIIESAPADVAFPKKP